jgi:endogenous inhibitor of DNA gyrase (YacG/DUF329 family)
MLRAQCPVCGKTFDPEQTRAMPFCSERCKLIDLGRWLDERYGVPHEPSMREDPEEPDRPA